jgi:hypothetical protein
VSVFLVLTIPFSFVAQSIRSLPYFLSFFRIFHCDSVLSSCPPTQGATTNQIAIGTEIEMGKEATEEGPSRKPLLPNVRSSATDKTTAFLTFFQRRTSLMCPANSTRLGDVLPDLLVLSRTAVSNLELRRKPAHGSSRATANLATNVLSHTYYLDRAWRWTGRTRKLHRLPPLVR